MPTLKRYAKNELYQQLLLKMQSAERKAYILKFQDQYGKDK